MTQSLLNIRPVRRIVTGENGNGKSLIISDGSTPHVTKTEFGVVAQVPWVTGEAAATGSEPVPAGRELGFHSEHGSILRIVDFPPDDTYDTESVKDFLDANDVRDTESPRHFWFHKTQSLDYAIVLEGEIYAMLDEDETLMRTGDVLVQRATNHSWSNRSNRPCRMAFVLISIEQDDAV